MDTNSEEYKRLKDLADSHEVRFNPAESEETIRRRIAAAILRDEGDTIYAAEILLGKDSKEFDDNENRALLGIHMVNNQLRGEKLKAKRDTFYGMPWRYYNNLLFEHGFDKVFSYEFRDTYNPSTMEEYSIFARRDRSFLLTAESYNSKKVVNSTKLHFELSLLFDGKPLEELMERCLWNCLEGCSHGPCFDSRDEHVARHATCDVREGFVSFLSKIETMKNQLNSPWKFYKDHFLWLCDYSETKDRGYDYKKINEKKILALPLDVQRMIGFTP
jgi:hypothetical protein